MKKIRNIRLMFCLNKGEKVVIVNLNRFNSDNLFVIKSKNTNLEPSKFIAASRVV